MNRLRADALAFCLVLIGYLLGGYVASELHELSDLGAVFFIPAGITAAAIHLTPARRWPYIIAAAFIAEFVTDVELYGFGVGASLGFASANALEPLLGGVIVRRWRGRIDISQRDDLAAFLIGSAVIGPFVGASIGSASVGAPDRFWSIMLSWWIGDGLGVLLVGGGILAVVATRDRWPTNPMEPVVGLGTTAAIAVGLHWITDFPLGFLAVVPVVTASARSGTRLGMAAAGIVAVVAIAGWFPASDGIPGVSASATMVIVQLELVCITAAALLVAAESSERESLSTQSIYQTETVRQLRDALAPESAIRTEHVSAEGVSQAASDRLEVGGDWYDIFEGDNGQVSIIIGDVVGHSANAVVGMGKMRSAAAALALRTSDTGLVLDWLDEFARSIDDRPYATAFFARFDPVAKTLTYSTAGHPPALLGKDDGTWEWLFRGRSTPIGVPFPQARPAATVQLDGSCTLIVYTDGAVERAGEVIDTGLARVFDAVTRRPNASVDQLLHEVTEETVRDDASFVRVRLRC